MPTGLQGPAGVLSTAELTFLHQNFVLSGGATVTVRTVSTTVYIRWAVRMLATPLCGKAASTFYEITCPLSGTIGTGQTATADGIPLGANIGNHSALHYVLPTTQGGTSVPGNFRLIPYNNSTENILPTYVLVAFINADGANKVVK